MWTTIGQDTCPWPMASMCTEMCIYTCTHIWTHTYLHTKYRFLDLIQQWRSRRSEVRTLVIWEVLLHMCCFYWLMNKVVLDVDLRGNYNRGALKCWIVWAIQEIFQGFLLIQILFFLTQHEPTNSHFLWKQKWKKMYAPWHLNGATRDAEVHPVLSLPVQWPGFWF